MDFRATQVAWLAGRTADSDYFAGETSGRFLRRFLFLENEIRVMVFFEFVRSPRSGLGGRGFLRPVSIASFRNTDPGFVKSIVSC
ncbi:MAG: hypothetical protein WAL59_25950 [Roseiarcus sp.]